MRTIYTDRREPLPQASGPRPLLVEQALPRYDAGLVEHLVVDVAPATAWAALRSLDLLTVRTPLLVASMWVRGIADRLARRRGAEPEPTVERLTLDDGLPGWVKLGEEPGREFAFGAIGVFWTPSITWREVEPEAFTGFSEPGYGKIAASLSVVPYGAGRSLIAYEVRTATTSAAARRGFARYWRLVRPFVRHIMRATLRTIRDQRVTGP